MIKELEQNYETYSLDEIKNLVSRFKATYNGEPVPPLMLTAFMIVGENASILNVDHFYKGTNE